MYNKPVTSTDKTTYDLIKILVARLFHDEAFPTICLARRISSSYVTAEEFYTYSLLESLMKMLFRPPEFPIIQLGHRLDENNGIRYCATVKSIHKRRDGRFPSLTQIYTGRSRGYVLLALLEEVEQKMQNQLKNDPDMPETEGPTQAMKEGKDENVEENNKSSDPTQVIRSRRNAKANKSQENKPSANPTVIPRTAHKDPTKNPSQAREHMKETSQAKEPLKNPSEPTDKGKGKTVQGESKQGKAEPSTTGRFNLRARKGRGDSDKDGGDIKKGEEQIKKDKEDNSKGKLDDDKGKEDIQKGKGDSKKDRGNINGDSDSDIQEVDQTGFIEAKRRDGRISGPVVID
ncbi:hypothetical protein P3342_006917 [Pyrenophora teres f. teres]|nr:hypothetical protein P3342_006917 [Pyrenophora teres f. teres]CAE7032737.1 hypothetical protein PTTW11_05070 [Pyrenophora teres f. teres]